VGVLGRFRRLETSSFLQVGESGNPSTGATGIAVPGRERGPFDGRELGDCRNEVARDRVVRTVPRLSASLPRVRSTRAASGSRSWASMATEKEDYEPAESKERAEGNRLAACGEAFSRKDDKPIRSAGEQPDKQRSHDRLA